MVMVGWEYCYPGLELPKDEKPHDGKQGAMRLDCQKEDRKVLHVQQVLNLSGFHSPQL